MSHNCPPGRLAALKKFGTGEIPREREREIHAMGARAVNANRARNKSFREAAEWFLNQPVSALNTENDAVKLLQEQYPDLNNREAMTIAVIAKGIAEGDVKSYVAVRDAAGEGPAQAGSVEPITITIKTVN